MAISFLQHEERAFVLKFSAIEIYNEVVRDLLSAESTSLRLWDDAEVRATNSYIFNFLEKRKRKTKRYPTVPMHWLWFWCCLFLQKGTYVENLTEVILRDSDHLKELISVCEGVYFSSLFKELLSLIPNWWLLSSQCTLCSCTSSKEDRRDILKWKQLQITPNT